MPVAAATSRGKSQADLLGDLNSFESV